MGEAKRRKQLAAKTQCPCTSSRVAAQCCFAGGAYYKRPADIDLETQPSGMGHDGCYLRELLACSEKLSREHLISEGVLNVLSTGDALVSGFPWQGAGEKKVIGKSNLVARCLCENHNNGMSPLDSAATGFFLALKKCHDEGSSPAIHHLISGHDLERWMLKTLAAFASSRNLARAGNRLAGHFDSGIHISDLLSHPERWIPPIGLYFSLKAGEHYRRNSAFAFSPLSSVDTDGIAGMTMDIDGMEFVFLLSGREADVRAVMRNTCYRPTNFWFKHPSVTHRIQLSWLDRKHVGDITVQAGVPRPDVLPPRFGQRGPFFHG